MEALRALVASLGPGFSPLQATFDVCHPATELEKDSDRAGRLGELEAAKLFKGVPGVHVFQCLRIPNSKRKGNSKTREIDLVLLTKKGIYVIEVKNWAGEVRIRPDGSWYQYQSKWNGTQDTKPVVKVDIEDIGYCAALLEDYITQSGVRLPPNFIDYKVFFINPHCRLVDEIRCHPKVLTSRSKASESFLERDLHQVDDRLHRQLKHILSTTPTWDRLYLEGGRIVIGDFLYFEGEEQDKTAVKDVKRSNTCPVHVEMHHVRSWFRNLLGLLVGMYPEVKLTCIAKQKKVVEATVSPNMEVVFRVVGSSRGPEAFLVNNICSLSLSI